MIAKFLAVPLAAALAVLSTGCANSNGSVPYVRAVGQPEARLRFVLPTAGMWVHGRLYVREGGGAVCPGNFYEVGNVGSALARIGTDGQSIGMLSNSVLDPNSYLERFIPAGKPYQLIAEATFANRTCTAYATFVPAANTDYQASFRVEHDTCQMFMTKLVKDPSGRVVAIADRTGRRSLCDE